MDPEDRGPNAREIRDRRRVIARVLEILPPEFVAKATRTTAGPHGTTVIWTNRGRMIASCANDTIAQFLNDAPGYLRAFSTYIEQLEQSAFHDRERRRSAEERLEAVSNELLAAASIGMNSKDGQRRVQAAIAVVREHRQPGSGQGYIPPNRRRS
jgi:hypothetical protein